MYSASFDRGNIDQFTFNREQLDDMKQSCQKRCFSTLNHNFALLQRRKSDQLDVGERKTRLSGRRSQF